MLKVRHLYITCILLILTSASDASDKTKKQVAVFEPGMFSIQVRKYLERKTSGDTRQFPISDYFLVQQCLESMRLKADKKNFPDSLQEQKIVFSEWSVDIFKDSHYELVHFFIADAEDAGSLCVIDNSPNGKIYVPEP